MRQFLALCPALLCCRKCGTALSGPGEGEAPGPGRKFDTEEKFIFSRKNTTYVRLFEKQIDVIPLGAAGRNHKCYYLLDTYLSILSQPYFL